MSYNTDFFRAYKNYLEEPVVRSQHDRAFKILSHPALDRVLDLGCGTAEYLNFYLKNKEDHLYCGVDEFKNPYYDDTILMNYRNIPADYCISGFTGFISLFSAEITAPVEENYKLYRQLFSNSEIKAGLVSGFYYESKRDQNPVIETGNLKSYQTLETLGFSQSLLPEDVRETRFEMTVPSKLFGADVVEVWKLFEKVDPHI